MTTMGRTTEDARLKEVGKRLDQGTAFLEACVHDGLCHSFDTANNAWVKPYPEVTGYALRWLCRHAPESPSIEPILKRLKRLQDRRGGFPTFFGDPQARYTFDTAVIARGFLAAYRLTGKKKWLKRARQAAGFIVNMQDTDGGFFPVWLNGQRLAPNDLFGGNKHAIHTKNVEALLDLAAADNRPELWETSRRAIAWSLEQPEISQSHPMGYFLEGLLAAHRWDDARQLVEQYVLPRLEPDGFLAAEPGKEYAYVSGSAQLGIILYKLGRIEEAERLVRWCERVQDSHTSGGLFQYVGRDQRPSAAFPHQEINSWGTKYFLELLLLTETNLNFNRTARTLYDLIARKLYPGETVLEAGSHTGHISMKLAVDWDLTLLDLDQPPLDEARARFNQYRLYPKVVQGDFRQHRPKRPYSAVWNSGVLQTYEPKDQSAVVRSLVDLADRLVILIVPDTAHTAFTNQAEHRTSGLTEALQQAGCQAVRHRRLRAGIDLDEPYDFLVTIGEKRTVPQL